MLRVEDKVIVISFVNAELSFVEGKGSEPTGGGNASLCRLDQGCGRNRPYASSAIRFFVMVDGLSLPNADKKA
jgi:hypothetical protein